MEKLHLTSARLKWAIEQKEKKDGIKISNSDLSRIAHTSRASVTNWLKGDNKISAENARALSSFLNVNAIWLETGEGDPNTKNGKERFTSLLTANEPLQEMVKQLNYMFVQLPQEDRDAIMSIANRFFSLNFPNETYASGKKPPTKAHQ